VDRALPSEGIGRRFDSGRIQFKRLTYPQVIVGFILID
jgi:hypothetical protein